MVRIKYTEAATVAWAVFDTSLAYTVINCPTCTANDSATAGKTVSGTAVSGTLNNPENRSYTGYSGTTTICFMDEDNTDESVTPDTSNIASNDLPCIENANVHWATSTSEPGAFNAGIDKTSTDGAYFAYLGMALGDAATTDPSTTDFIMNQFETAGKMDSSTKKWAIALSPDDGDDNQDDTTESFMDMGTSTTTSLRDPSIAAKSIKFSNSQQEWLTTIKGINFGIRESGKYGLDDNTYITVETARQCLYVPSADYEEVHRETLYQSTGFYYSSDGDTMVDCGDIQRMETIKLLISDYWVEIAAYDYINAVRIEGTSRSSGFCRVCLKESWDDDWHVGTSMLVGYYTEFDFSESTISFSPMTSASKLDLE